MPIRAGFRMRRAGARITHAVRKSMPRRVHGSTKIETSTAGSGAMQTLSEAMRQHALQAGDAIAVSDDAQTLNRRDFAARVLDMAASLQDGPRVIGPCALKGTAWAVTQLACALAGKLVVPLP